MGPVLSKEANVRAWWGWAGSLALLHGLGLGMEHRQRPRLRLELRFEADVELNRQHSGGWQGTLFSLDGAL